jgi:hypothetical protein
MLALDGSAFTGAVSVYVTVDAGTQAIGSVGSGACTHEGNGYHTYAPAQAETNGDLVGFTFVGSGAANSTVQVFTKAGDAFTRLGAPVGASISADLAAVPTALQNADALLNRDMSAVSDTTARSPLNALRFLRNKWAVAGSTLTVNKEDDTTAAWTAAVSTAPGADPISGADPA